MEVSGEEQRHNRYILHDLGRLKQCNGKYGGGTLALAHKATHPIQESFDPNIWLQVSSKLQLGASWSQESSKSRGRIKFFRIFLFLFVWPGILGRIPGNQRAILGFHIQSFDEIHREKKQVAMTFSSIL